jgi:hypothetical protein
MSAQAQPSPGRWFSHLHALAVVRIWSKLTILCCAYGDSTPLLVLHIDSRVGVPDFDQLVC